jgi:4-hydroxy-tetrahydrodipicolinate synthase
MAKMCDLAMDGDNAACLRMHDKLVPLHELMFIETSPIPLKWAMHKMGLINNELRLPLTPLSATHQNALEQVLKNLELI